LNFWVELWICIRELEQALIESGVPASHWNMAELPGVENMTSQEICQLLRLEEPLFDQKFCQLLGFKDLLVDQEICQLLRLE
jgi:hypothetical protein